MNDDEDDDTQHVYDDAQHVNDGVDGTADVRIAASKVVDVGDRATATMETPTARRATDAAHLHDYDRQSPDIQRHCVARFGHVNVAIHLGQNTADTVDTSDRPVWWRRQSTRRRRRMLAAYAGRILVRLRRRHGRRRRRFGATVGGRTRHNRVGRSVGVANHATRFGGAVRPTSRLRHDALTEDFRTLEGTLENAAGTAAAAATRWHRRFASNCRRRRCRRRSVEQIPDQLLVGQRQRFDDGTNITRHNATVRGTRHLGAGFAGRRRPECVQIRRDALQQRMQLVGVDFTVQIRVERRRYAGGSASVGLSGSGVFAE